MLSLILCRVHNGVEVILCCVRRLVKRINGGVGGARTAVDLPINCFCSRLSNYFNEDSGVGAKTFDGVVRRSDAN